MLFFQISFGLTAQRNPLQGAFIFFSRSRLGGQIFFMPSRRRLSGPSGSASYAGHEKFLNESLKNGPDRRNQPSRKARIDKAWFGLCARLMA